MVSKSNTATSLTGLVASACPPLPHNEAETSANLLGDDRIPDEITILNFRHLLERHGLTEAIFADMNASCRKWHHTALDVEPQ